MRGDKGGSWRLAEEGPRPEQEKLGPQGHHGTLLGLFHGKQVPMGGATRMAVITWWQGSQ